MVVMPRFFPVCIGAISLAIAPSLGQLPASAQLPPPAPSFDFPTTAAPYPVCQPPSSGEYLLLILSSTPESQDKVRQTLPPNAVFTICNYLDDVVTRVSGFSSIDNANAWARYMSETIGLPAFVARPAEMPPTATPTTPPTPTTPTPSPGSIPPSTSTSTATFNPKPLGAGYAVLVDYFNTPQTAVQVKQLLKRDVGLVAYGQRPYLLALYTADAAVANSFLKTLTERGFWSMVVDSRRVMLLKSAIDTSRLK